MPHTHLGLLVKVRGQLDQPGRLDGRHIAHVVFGRLHDFVEHHPGEETVTLQYASVSFLLHAEDS